ncbi:MAG: hypothetical protein JST89_03025 [Cyanobacteria bacterium SZAS-4]|nr:hypothetical protein [Cyanobacteria bacterium SZAS-4]
MICFPIRTVPTLFIKGFTADDVQTILNFVRKADSNSTARTRDVLFIDTPITGPTVEAVHKLKAEGYRVIYRDHHAVEGEPASDRDRQVIKATEKLRQNLGSDCLITTRGLHPACSTLVSVGEFKDALAIVADPDADGLTAAMKAVGIFYEGMDEDAAKLDGQPSLQVTGTPLSQLLAKGVATLPTYDPEKHDERERAQERLFARWVSAVEGDQRAIDSLQTGVTTYDEAVLASHEIAPKAREVAPGVVLADVMLTPFFDVGTLLALLEDRPGCKVTVIKKGNGPIAALHGVQYSLAVAKPYQDEIKFPSLLPPHAKSDPSGGIISNLSFLLHVNERVWNEYILPGLRNLP